MVARNLLLAGHDTADKPPEERHISDDPGQPSITRAPSNNTLQAADNDAFQHAPSKGPDLHPSDLAPASINAPEAGQLPETVNEAGLANDDDAPLTHLSIKDREASTARPDKLLNTHAPEGAQSGLASEQTSRAEEGLEPGKAPDTRSPSDPALTAAGQGPPLTLDPALTTGGNCPHSGPSDPAPTAADKALSEAFAASAAVPSEVDHVPDNTAWLADADSVPSRNPTAPISGPAPNAATPLVATDVGHHGVTGTERRLEASRMGPPALPPHTSRHQPTDTDEPGAEDISGSAAHPEPARSHAPAAQQRRTLSDDDEAADGRLERPTSTADQDAFTVMRFGEVHAGENAGEEGALGMDQGRGSERDRDRGEGGASEGMQQPDWKQAMAPSWVAEADDRPLKAPPAGLERRHREEASKKMLQEPTTGDKGPSKHPPNQARREGGKATPHNASPTHEKNPKATRQHSMNRLLRKQEENEMMLAQLPRHESKFRAEKGPDAVSGHRHTQVGLGPDVDGQEPAGRQLRDKARTGKRRSRDAHAGPATAELMEPDQLSEASQHEGVQGQQRSNSVKRSNTAEGQATDHRRDQKTPKSFGEPQQKHLKQQKHAPNMDRNLSSHAELSAATRNAELSDHPYQRDQQHQPQQARRIPSEKQTPIRGDAESAAVVQAHQPRHHPDQAASAAADYLGPDSDDEVQYITESVHASTHAHDESPCQSAPLTSARPDGQGASPRGSNRAESRPTSMKRPQADAHHQAPRNASRGHSQPYEEGERGSNRARPSSKNRQTRPLDNANDAVDGEEAAAAEGKGEDEDEIIRRPAVPPHQVGHVLAMHGRPSSALSGPLALRPGSASRLNGLIGGLPAGVSGPNASVYSSGVASAAAGVRERLAGAAKREAEARFELEMKALDAAELREQLRVMEGVALQEAQAREQLQRQLEVEREEVARVRLELKDARRQLKEDGRLRAIELELEASQREKRAAQSKASALEDELARVKAELERESRLRKDAEASLRDYRLEADANRLLSASSKASARSRGLPELPVERIPSPRSTTNLMAQPGFGQHAGDPLSLPASAPAMSAEVATLVGALKQADATNKALLRSRQARKASPEPTEDYSEDNSPLDHFESRIKRLEAIARSRPVTAGPQLGMPATHFYPASPPGSPPLYSPSRSESPTKRMLGVLSRVDANIMKTRNLRGSSGRNPIPQQLLAPAQVPALLAAPQLAAQPTPAAPPPAVNINHYHYGPPSPSRSEANAHAENGRLWPPDSGPAHAHHPMMSGSAPKAIMPAPAERQVAYRNEPAQPRDGRSMQAGGAGELGFAAAAKCTGRRPKVGDSSHRSVEDITPPEHVREDVLRQARIEYFADVQRIKQKRLSELAAHEYL